MKAEKKGRGWRVTMNGEERELGYCASLVVMLLAAPAVALVLLAVVLCLAAAVLAIPAFATGWLLTAAKRAG